MSVTTTARARRTPGQRVGALLALAFLALPSCSSEDAGRHCRARLGAAGVDGTASTCPVVTTFELLPSEVSVGSSVTLRGSAMDPGGGALSYTWRAGTAAAVVIDPASATTTLRCDAAGPVVVTLTVSNGKCDYSASGVVDCVAPPR